MARSSKTSRGSPKIDYHGGGIYSRFNKREGETYYFIRYTLPDGRRKKEKVGTRKQDAKDLLEQRRTEIRLGTYKDPRQKAAESETFSDYADTFMRDYGNLRRSDHYKDRMKHIRAFLGKMPVREINRADLDRFVAKRLMEVSPTTVRKDIAALGTIFKKAVEWEVIKASPAFGLKKPPESKPRTRYLIVEEWKQLEATCPPWLRSMLVLAVATGMRLKEVSKLRWDDIDWQANVIHVPMDTKTGTRAIPLNRTAKTALEKLVRHLRNPYVFVDTEGDHYDTDQRRNQISRGTSKAMRGAKIKGASFHTLRHTAASFMVQAGVPLYEVQKILGHSTPLMTERYAHLQPEHLRNATKALDQALNGPNSAPPSGRAKAAGAETSANPLEKQ